MPEVEAVDTPKTAARAQWWDGLMTERLGIRSATPADAEALFAYRRQASVSTWLARRFSSVEEWTVYHHGRFRRTAVVELGGVPIGDIHIQPRDAVSQHDVAELAKATEVQLGWVFDPCHQGHGLATEAVRGIISRCFELDIARRVVAACFARNNASWAVMEKVGMRREALQVKSALTREGSWEDRVTYALLREEWRG